MSFFVVIEENIVALLLKLAFLPYLQKPPKCCFALQT